jgi:hypothetical protein
VPDCASRRGWSRCRWVRIIHGHARYDAPRNPGTAGASGRKAPGYPAPAGSKRDPAHDRAGRSAASAAHPHNLAPGGSARVRGTRQEGSAGLVHSVSACRAGSASCRRLQSRRDRHKDQPPSRRTTAIARRARCASGQLLEFSTRVRPDHGALPAAPSARSHAATHRPSQGQAAFAARRASFRGRKHPM